MVKHDILWDNGLTQNGQQAASWWRHQMETFSALLAICAGNSPVSGEFPSQRPVTRSFEVSLIGALNKRLSKKSWGWWFEPPSCSLWRHCNALKFYDPVYIYIHTCVVKYTSLVIFKARNTRMDRSKIIYTKSAATSHEVSLNDGR